MCRQQSFWDGLATYGSQTFLSKVTIQLFIAPNLGEWSKTKWVRRSGSAKHGGVKSGAPQRTRLGEKHVDVSRNLTTLIFGSMNDQALTAIGKVNGGMPQVCFPKAQTSNYISNPKVSLANLPISAAKPATASPGKSPNQLPIAHGPTAAWQYRDNCRSTAGSTTSTAAFLPAAPAAKIPRLSARCLLILVARLVHSGVSPPNLMMNQSFGSKHQQIPMVDTMQRDTSNGHEEWPSVRLT